MNERIKLLAEQCYEHDQSWTGVGQRIFNKEKFAELLLQECVDACWRANKISYSVPPTQQQVALDCVREIETTLRS